MILFSLLVAGPPGECSGSDAMQCPPHDALLVRLESTCADSARKVKFKSVQKFQNHNLQACSRLATCSFRSTGCGLAKLGEAPSPGQAGLTDACHLSCICLPGNAASFTTTPRTPPCCTGDIDCSPARGSIDTESRRPVVARSTACTVAFLAPYSPCQPVSRRVSDRQRIKKNSRETPRSHRMR